MEEPETTAVNSVQAVIEPPEDLSATETPAEDAPGAEDAPDEESARVVHAGFTDQPELHGTERLAGRIWSILPEVHLEIAASLAAADVESRSRLRADVQTITPSAQQGSIAVVPLRGVITPRGSFIARLFGVQSGLERFLCDFREAVNDDSVKAIILDVDSPGGTIDMVPETAAEVFAARGKKPIVAVANTLCASAAYWIACQADELVVSPSGQVGSIGVFTVHEDLSGMVARIGVKVTVISAGRFKTEGNSYEPLSKQAQQALQSKADDLYSMFTSDIARARGVPVEAVQAGYGEGRCVLANPALALKMVDRVETFEQTAMRLGASALDDDEDEEGSDDPVLDSDDDDDLPGPDDDESPEARETAGGSHIAAAADYLSGERNRAPWQIGASRPLVGGRL